MNPHFWEKLFAVENKLFKPFLHYHPKEINRTKQKRREGGGRGEGVRGGGGKVEELLDRGWWLMPVIPATQEVKTRESWFEANPGQKLARSHFNHRHMPMVPAMQEDVGRKIMIHVSTRQKWGEPIFKNDLKAKQAGDTAQVAEHLPSKYKTLSSNIVLPKKVELLGH
jgi:hypothetical protein